MLAVTAICAALLAVIIGIIKQKRLIEQLFAMVNINKIHSVPTAWDYYFSKQEASWIIVTLKNGRTIYGKFSDQSFASSDPEERDLYIQKTYVINENMIWQEDDKSKGILISKDAIETIEFLA